MKKLLLLNLLLILLNVKAEAQTPYYDALFLKRYLNNRNELSYENFKTSNEQLLKKAFDKEVVKKKHDSIKIILGEIKQSKMDSILSLLKRYKIITDEDTVSEDRINNAIHKNIFFKSITYNGKTHAADNKRQTNLNIHVASVLSSLGGVDVTSLSQGLSLFLISRAKEELNIAFFHRLNKYFVDNEEIRILFPNTSDKVTNLLEYQYTEMLPVLQEAFNKDMESIPENMIQVLLMDKYYKDIKDFPEFLVIIKSFSLIKEINNLSPPAIIDKLPSIADIDTLKLDELGKCKLINLSSSFKLLKIFSNSVRIDSNRTNCKKDDSIRNWVTTIEFYRNIVKDSSTFKIFLGLLYQQVKNDTITFNHIKLDSLISSKNNEVIWYSMQFSKLLSLTEKIDNTFKELVQLKNENKKPDRDDYYNYLNTTLELAEFGYNVANHYNNNNIAGTEYVYLARQTFNMYIYTISGKHTLAMNNALNIIDDIFRILKSKAKYPFLNNSNVPVRINIIGTFIANVADAKTPEQVKTAIETVALPAGSSSFKKYHHWNFSINGYLGANFNFNNQNKSNDTWKRALCVTAPVGLNLTLASFGKRGSVSLFGSIIDIGAIADYQLKDSTIEQKIYLKNIFSPGGYLIYGCFGNIPLSLGIGGQYGPGLLKIEKATTNPTLRINAFLAFDIPIINLTQGKLINRYKVTSVSL